MRSIDDILTELGEAVRILDRDRVGTLTRELIDGVLGYEVTLTLRQAKQVLGLLRRKRFFAEMQRVGDALIQTGESSPVVRRQYAQSLIDQGALTAAEAVLRELVLDAANDPEEYGEARGLLGRVYKQRYVEGRKVVATKSPVPAVTATAAGVLRDAIQSYYSAYSEHPDTMLWHGINAVACIARAKRDGVAVDAALDPVAIATAILARIDQMKDPQPNAWDMATALEACVALDQRRTAVGWAMDYVKSADADAFEIASTMRQLTEVWALNGTTGMGEAILPILRDALLQRESGHVILTGDEARASSQHLEKVLGYETFSSLTWYRSGLNRAKCVARIGVEEGRGIGTGFLVRGRDLSPRFENKPQLLVTNSHVISQTPGAYTPPALAYEDAVITFEAQPLKADGTAHTYKATGILAESPSSELDFAVIELDQLVDGITDADLGEVTDRLPLNDQKQRVFIIGHPSGGTLSFSLQDNLLLDYEDPRLHYRAPTEGGSSGSPVYSSTWKLIGLHHAGDETMKRLHGASGTYAANEGIWIAAIRRFLKDPPAHGAVVPNGG